MKNRISKIEDIFKSKELFHRKLAKIHFDEKIEILVKLQKLANDIKIATGRKKERVWKIK